VSGNLRSRREKSGYFPQFPLSREWINDLKSYDTTLLYLTLYAIVPYEIFGRFRIMLKLATDFTKTKYRP